MTGRPVPSRIVGFDLLRGTAVALVLLRHAAPTRFPGAGVVGVVMFFAISGYLITGLLLDEAQATGRVDLGRFYRRRARRLLPALLLLLVGVAAVTVVLDPIGDRHRLPVTLLKAITFTGDVPWGRASDATFHLWTLGVEEQFYLLWPRVLLLGIRRGRPQWALAAAGIVCLLATLATVAWLHRTPDLGYALPTSWAGCFVIGAAGRIHRDRLRAGRGWAAACVLALAVLAVVPLRGHAWTYLVAAPAVAALTVVLLTVWREWRRLSHPALRALAGLGVLSYAVYLWDYPLTIWLRPHLAGAGLVAAVLAITLAAAPSARSFTGLRVPGPGA